MAMKTNLFSSGLTYHTMVNLLYQALLALFLYNGCVMGLTDWPDGKYGLLKPETGCPDEWAGKSWNSTKFNYWPYDEYKGWTDRAFVFQVTEETFPNETLHFDGHIGPSFVMRYFCVKRTTVIKSSITWPSGKYCFHDVYQYRSKKKWGWIKMYDRDYGYSHATKYVFDFARNRYYGITFYFACQTSGNKTIPISLPITKPFYLLPYESRDCQQVQWMVATSEWIKYQTDNYEGRRDQESGTVPYHELGDKNNKGITMYYCHYESCNYTLTDKEGVFQSPGFPDQYPDGQLCSWRITVPENHTLHVNFTHFSLIGQDNLQFFKNVTRSFILNNTFYGNRQLNVTATKDVEFVFNTDMQYNSTGFQAHYRVFIPIEITTTKLPTTTSKTTTTTQPTTTKAPTNKPLQTNTPTKTNKPTRKVLHTTQWKASNDGESNSFKGSRLFSCDTTSNIIVIVIPLLCCILVIALVVDIVYRCRYTKNKGKSEPNSNPRNGDCLAVNMTYERGDIIINQPADTVTDASTVNRVDDQPHSRDEPPDYEDVDYTQLNDIPPPRRSSKRQEWHALEPIDADTSAVFYHVLEPPNTESGPPQSYVAKPVGKAGPDVFYHTLEPPTGLTGPCYQNMCDLNRYTLNPLYESSENSAPLVEANKLYDNYIA